MTTLAPVRRLRRLTSNWTLGVKELAEGLVLGAFLGALAGTCLWFTAVAAEDLGKTRQVTATFESVIHDGECFAHYVVDGRAYRSEIPCPQAEDDWATRWYDPDKPEELGADSPLVIRLLMVGFGSAGLILVLLALMAVRAGVMSRGGRPSESEAVTRLAETAVRPPEPAVTERGRIRQSRRTWRFTIRTLVGAGVLLLGLPGAGLAVVGGWMVFDGVVPGFTTVPGDLSREDGCTLTYQVDGRTYVSHDSEHCETGADDGPVSVELVDDIESKGSVRPPGGEQIGSGLVMAALGGVMIGMAGLGERWRRRLT